MSQLPFVLPPKNEIIQCPNPTANPISNHLKQKQLQKEHTEQLKEIKNMKQFQQQLAAQNELIEKMNHVQQSLIHQTNQQSLQLMQYRNYIQCLQQQNHALLSAYNALKGQKQTTESAMDCGVGKWKMDILNL